MAKRGTSGLSCVVAVDKPLGKSSHDIVNACRKIYNERRVGHTGTLDPLASGVMVVCVGPATRLDAYLSEHDKAYAMDIQFGTSTTTDDAEGDVVSRCVVEDKFFDRQFAECEIKSLIGKGKQIPPVYSAIKVDGKKSYAAAREGNIIHLESRDFEIFDATLNDIVVTENDKGERVAVWKTTMHVSKGTYMRSIARDLGHALGCVAHVSGLRRLRVGSLSIDDCATLDELSDNSRISLVDPLRLLGCRYAFADKLANRVSNGSYIHLDDIVLNEPIKGDIFDAFCCTTSVIPSSWAISDGEVIALVVDNCLKALYEYDTARTVYKARCIFSIGVERGSGI